MIERIQGKYYSHSRESVLIWSFSFLLVSFHCNKKEEEKGLLESFSQSKATYNSVTSSRTISTTSQRENERKGRVLTDIVIKASQDSNKFLIPFHDNPQLGADTLINQFLKRVREHTVVVSRLPKGSS